MMISSNTSNGKCCRRRYRRRVSSLFYTHLDSTATLEYPIDHIASIQSPAYQIQSAVPSSNIVAKIG